jgi:hypothetical protein
MKTLRHFLYALSLLVVFQFLTGCNNSPSTTSVAGTYVSQTDPANSYIELRSDATFYSKQPDHFGIMSQIAGNYHVDGNAITVELTSGGGFKDGGSLARMTLDGHTLTDPFGTKWTLK